MAEGRQISIAEKLTSQSTRAEQARTSAAPGADPLPAYAAAATRDAVLASLLKGQQLRTIKLDLISPGWGLFLAVLLDAFSRRVVGWHLARQLDAGLVLGALEMALEGRTPEIHHSDRGVQYACQGYVERFLAAGAQISMSRKGCPLDNAQAESFFSRFKAELMEDGVFEDLAQARSEIFSYIEGYYNRVRLHSGLGYKSPMEFELELKTKNGGKIDSFLSTKTCPSHRSYCEI